MAARGPDAFVSGALAIVLYVSRVIGIAPLRFEKQHGGWRVRFSPCLYPYGCALVTVNSLITFTNLFMKFQEDPTQSLRLHSSMRSVVWALDVTTMVTLGFYGAVAAPRHLKSMIVCLNYLQKINIELNVPHWPKRNENKKGFLLFIWSMLAVVVTLFDSVLVLIDVKNHRSNNIQASIMNFFYYPFYWMMQLLVYQFILVTLHIRQSFKVVNGKLKALSQGMSRSKRLPLKPPMVRKIFTVNNERKKSANTIIDSLAFFGKVKTTDVLNRPVHEDVHDLALTFGVICDMVKETDKCYGPMLLLLLCSILLHMIITPYHLIINTFTLPRDSPHRGLDDIIIQCLWCLYHAGNLVMVIEPCHLTFQEISSTREQLSQLMRHVTLPTEPLAVELDLFYRHLVINQVSYSPLQVTTFNRSLVVTILGSIITYLVVMIQL